MPIRVLAATPDVVGRRRRRSPGRAVVLTQASDPEPLGQSQERLDVGVPDLDLAVVHEVEEVDDVVVGDIPQDDDGVRGRVGPEKAAEEQRAG